MKISISPGNVKMGAIPSVSLPPVATCPKNAPCYKKCYARRMAARYPNVRNAYENNLQEFLNDPQGYFLQVQAAAITTRFFRWHVAGDIPNAEYLGGMIETAQKCPCTSFLCFTKQFDIVNDFLNGGGTIPENLKIIFSTWNEYRPAENPHNLPLSAVIFRGQETPENVKSCGGNCTECACRGVGCWELKNGETIAFYEH